MGSCPGCGLKIGALAALLGWSNWGRFVCPGCGKRIGFRLWLLAVVVLMGLMFGIERLLHLMLILEFPLWLSFGIALVGALAVMFFVPMIWRFQEEKPNSS